MDRLKMKEGVTGPGCFERIEIGPFPLIFRPFDRLITCSTLATSSWETGA